MTNGDLTPGDNIVDEAADVERRLANIRELIVVAETKEAAKDTNGSKDSQVIQEDKVVVANVAGVVGNGLNEVFMFFFCFWGTWIILFLGYVVQSLKESLHYCDGWRN